MSTKELVARLRKASRAIYLATEEAVADDISSKLTRAADTIERLERERDEAGAQIVSAREECPLVRRQDYFGTPLPALVAAQVSELFGWQSRAENAESELTTLRARVARLEDGHREIIWREVKAWAPVRAYRTAEEADVDDARNETWTSAADISRSALTEEPAS